ncbi:hypothetical protein J4032_18395 [Streptomyces formicae]|uniref:Uncharacterized protein n=1 Tax=Streptomyces formicae TaxID=1616117 RepID=A0ABY3WKP5_9ACTN|nr:hypothetical protein [Streptomyces formicae]UNM13195.1 hypothetical protein J4032_18375 [Streptomyces formicae]UNM13198.1 hypothetical protein J4032_18395 [Streptomyces formicae]
MSLDRNQGGAILLSALLGRPIAWMTGLAVYAWRRVSGMALLRIRDVPQSMCGP